MKSLYKIVAVVGLSIMTTSCFDKAKPNYQFFPNMYEAVSYETYSEHNVFKDGVEAQLPAKGSIKRGFVPYEIPNTPEGYALAKASLKSPLDSLSINQDKAKELYTIYCGICHGDKGDGKGNLVVKEKFLGVPSYADREITEGSIYHVVTYGLNSMGSHANQLSQEERWIVADYVLKLKAGL
ncbi:cytochrome c [Flavobacterium cucumis]|uniref:Quinol:cytochrome c oxidoreductase monoheme cytochrome subunit n=1 Tax=Flavobacterium cucumis TaxID=416016 RepID=A0A1M7ZT82_9FLAO|nr:cytochrome c [Flavobacterium cucumis]SHO72101.1 quinol:cytochrome c oxidoreductase monoheme cytochrome subunit [Flavobacterium cucumis]